MDFEKEAEEVTRTCGLLGVEAALRRAYLAGLIRSLDFMEDYDRCYCDTFSQCHYCQTRGKIRSEADRIEKEGK